MIDPYGYSEFIDEGYVYLVIMSVLWGVAYLASLFVHSHEHRLDRGAFIGWYMLLLSASGLIILLIMGSFWLLLTFANMEFELKTLYIAWMIVSPLSGWLNGKLISARLHDIGLPKFIGLLMIFPFVNLLSLLSLAIMPSHSGSDFRWFLSANRL